MYEIAHGIKIYYKNQKDCCNIVFLSDGTYKYYNDGAILFELVSDEAIYMLTEKVENMIKAFPDKQKPATSDSITEYFKWLNGTIEDEDIPVATEIFRSSFNDAIQQTVAAMVSAGDFATVENFFMECYAIYMDHVKAFCIFVQAIAANASGIADDFQQAVAEVFVSSADDLYEVYTRRCSVRREEGHVLVETVSITNFLQLLTFEHCRLKKAKKAIKECANCGRLFIPLGRVDTIYCPFPAPGYSGKSCKDIGAQLRRTQKRQSDPKEHEHHNTTCRLHNVVRRAKENGDSDDVISYYQHQIDSEMMKYADQKESGGSELWKGK